MTMHQTLRPAALALLAALTFSPLTAHADDRLQPEFVVSQDARFHMGQLVRADTVPAGIRTITYPQFVAQQRRQGRTAPTFAAMFNSTGAWSIGVFR